MRETVSNKQHTVRRLVRKRKHDWYNIPVRTAVVYTLVLNSSIQSKQAHLLVASLIHTSDYSTNVVERLDYSTTRWFNQSNLLSHRFIRYNHHEVIHPVPSIKRSLQRKLSTIYSISQLNAFFFNFYIYLHADELIFTYSIRSTFIERIWSGKKKKGKKNSPRFHSQPTNRLKKKQVSEFFGGEGDFDMRYHIPARTITQLVMDWNVKFAVDVAGQRTKPKTEEADRPRPSKKGPFKNPRLPQGPVLRLGFSWQ